MKILAGLLHTPEGDAALEKAAVEALSADAELHVVGFVSDPSASNVADYGEEKKRHEAELDEAIRKLRARGVTCTGHLGGGTGSPSQAILEVARQEAVDLIVVGIRRRSRVGKLVLGSNAQDIILGADCPVLAVKAMDADADGG